MAIERVQLKFCKDLLGVKTTTQNDFVYGELGRTDLLNIRTLNVIRYWLKVSSLENHKYAKCMYLSMYQQLEDEPERNTWVKMVKNVPILLGFNGV